MQGGGAARCGVPDMHALAVWEGEVMKEHREMWALLTS